MSLETIDLKRLLGERGLLSLSFTQMYFNKAVFVIEGCQT